MGVNLQLHTSLTAAQRPRVLLLQQLSANSARRHAYGAGDQSATQRWPSDAVLSTASTQTPSYPRRPVRAALLISAARQGLPEITCAGTAAPAAKTLGTSARTWGGFSAIRCEDLRRRTPVFAATHDCQRASQLVSGSEAHVKAMMSSRLQMPLTDELAVTCLLLRICR